MHTYQVTAALPGYALTDVRFHYTRIPSSGAIRSVGDEITVPAEPARVEIFAMSIKKTNGRWVGVCKGLDNDLLRSWERKIEESLQPEKMG